MAPAAIAGTTTATSRAGFRSTARKSIKPVAGLLADLKARGLLEDTLVVWASEMGRTPFDNNLVTRQARPRSQPIRPGSLDGRRRCEGGRHLRRDGRIRLEERREPIPLRDVHATILRLLGLDQDRLTYLNAGRYKKLTDIGGRIINEVITL